MQQPDGLSQQSRQEPSSADSAGASGGAHGALDEEEEELRVAVWSIAGADLGTFAVSRADFVRDLKQRVEAATSIPAREQRLLSQGGGDRQVAGVPLDDGARIPREAIDGAGLQLIRVRACAARTAIRCRPLNSRERDIGSECAVFVDAEERKVVVRTGEVTEEGEAPEMSAGFADFIYEGPEQEPIFRDIAADAVHNLVQGQSGAILAYGPTGTGKTFTMTGVPDHPGVMPRVFERTFEAVRDVPDRNFQIYASMFEMEEAGTATNDLLVRRSRERLTLREHPRWGPVMPGLAVVPVAGPEELEHLVEEGFRELCVLCTMMERTSSMSCVVFTILVVSRRPEQLDSARVSKLLLVDMPGSEFGTACGKSVPRNLVKSISSIRQVLEALSEQSSCSVGRGRGAATDRRRTFVPYRNSKVTMMLRECLGGRASLAVIATCSPAASAVEETLRTLAFLELVRGVVCCPEDIVVDRADIDALGARAPAGYPPGHGADGAGGTPDESWREKFQEATERFFGLQHT